MRLILKVYIILMINYTSNVKYIAADSCAISCFCDEDGLYVSCIGDKSWDKSLPLIPANVLRLEMRNYKSSLLNNDYLNFHSIQELRLQDMNMNTIENNTFINLNMLKSLDLSLNNLKFLYSYNFNGIQGTLIHLDISNNNLINIDGAFIYCNKLRTINLQNNYLTNLTLNTFNGLKQLQYLNLDNNFIKYIEIGTFISLTNLIHLIISNNPIHPIQIINKQIENKTDMVPITSGEYNSFIQDNASSLDIISLFSTTTMKALLVNNERKVLNKTEEIEDKSDAEEKAAAEEAAEEENKTTITATRFDLISTHLQYIDLSNISLVKFPSSIDIYVKQLHLSGNYIKFINSGDLDNYIHLSHLILDNNIIQYIENDAFGRLEKLIKLWLNNNKLMYIPYNLPISLRELYLNYNLIKEIANDSFYNLINLQYLYLANNNINKLNINCFKNLKSLKILHLQYNKLTYLPSNIFKYLVSLNILNISYNPFLKFNPYSFNNLNNLRSLSLIGINTSLLLMDNIFNYTPLLTILDLQSSPYLTKQIINNTNLLTPLKSLEELNLINNQLKSLNSNFLQYLPSLKLIKLTQNLWHCDNNILPLIKWLQNNTLNIHFYDRHNIICSSPLILRFKPLIAVHYDDIHNISCENHSIRKEDDIINNNDIILQQSLTAASITADEDLSLSSLDARYNITNTNNINGSNNTTRWIESKSFINNKKSIYPNKISSADKLLSSRNTVQYLLNPSSTVSPSSTLSINILPKSLLPTKRKNNKLLSSSKLEANDKQLNFNITKRLNLSTVITQETLSLSSSLISPFSSPSSVSNSSLSLLNIPNLSSSSSNLESNITNKYNKEILFANHTQNNNTLKYLLNYNIKHTSDPIQVKLSLQTTEALSSIKLSNLSSSSNLSASTLNPLKESFTEIKNKMMKTKDKLNNKLLTSSHSMDTNINKSLNINDQLANNNNGNYFNKKSLNSIFKQVKHLKKLSSSVSLSSTASNNDHHIDDNVIKKEDNMRYSLKHKRITLSILSTNNKLYKSSSPSTEKSSLSSSSLFSEINYWNTVHNLIWIFSGLIVICGCLIIIYNVHNNCSFIISSMERLKRDRDITYLPHQEELSFFTISNVDISNDLTDDLIK